MPNQHLNVDRQSSVLSGMSFHGKPKTFPHAVNQACLEIVQMPRCMFYNDHGTWFALSNHGEFSIYTGRLRLPKNVQTVSLKELLMLGGMQSMASASDAIQAHQDVVAENLAHINTPGYRRQVMSFHSLLAGASAGSTSQPQHVGAEQAQKAFDFSPGEFQRTSRPLDFAINGDGFFEIESTAGARYTRNGVFFIGQENTLVTASGNEVVGVGGSISLPANTSPNQIKVSDDGTIQVDGNEVGQLKIVAFEDNSQLERDGAVTFKAGEEAVESDSSALVLQGHRELSNVSATHELVKLITGVRHHEATQRALRSLSDTLQQRTRPR